MFLPNLFLFFHGEEDSQTLVADVLPEPPAHVKILMAIANKVFLDDEPNPFVIPNLPTNIVDYHYKLFNQKNTPQFLEGYLKVGGNF